MAENLETLAIKIDLDSNPVIQGLNKIAEAFNRISEEAKQTGDSADSASNSMREVGEAGEEVGEKTEEGSRRAQKSLDQLDRYSNQLFRRLRRYIAPFAVIGMGKKLFSGFIGEATALEDVATKAKMSMSELDAWRRANTACGGSAEEFTKALQDWSAKTGKSGDEFIRLGQRLNSLTDKQQDAQLKYMGLTRESASVFMQSNSEMAELVTRYRSMALTPQDAENARKFRMQWAITKGEMKSIGLELAKGFMPLLDSVASKFKKTAEFLREHSQFVKIALEGIAVAAALAFGKKSILGTLSFMKSPVGQAIGLILLLAMAIDDLVTFVKGGQSAFEDMLRSIGMGDDEINGIRDSFKGVWESIKKLIEVCEPLLKILAKVGSKAIVDAIDLVASVIGTIVTGIRALFEDSPEAQKAFEDMLHALGEVLKRIWEDIKGAIQAVVDYVKPKWDEMWKSFDEAVQGAYDSVVNWCKDVYDSIVKWFKDAFDSVLQFFLNIWNTIIEKIKGIKDALKQALVEALESVPGAKLVERGIETVSNGISNLIDKGKNALGLGGSSETVTPELKNAEGMAGGRTTITNTSETENKINITINNADGDAEGVRKAGAELGNRLGETNARNLTHSGASASF